MTETGNDPAQERHYHWEFMAYDEELAVPEGSPRTIMWPVTVGVVGYLSEADARLGVEATVQRNQYRLCRVWECATCGFQGRIGEAMRKMSEAM